MHPAATFGDNADIYTLGGRVSGLLEDHWKYSAEGAYQFGRKTGPGTQRPAVATTRCSPPPPRPRASATSDAFGVNSKLTYLFKDN